MPQPYVRVAGVWHPSNDIQYKVGGVWKPVQNGYQRISGAWTPIYARDTTPPGQSTLRLTANTSSSPYRISMTLALAGDADVADVVIGSAIGGYPASINSAGVGSWTGGLGIQSPFPKNRFPLGVYVPIGDWYPPGGCVPGTRYCFNAWTRDTAGNVGIPYPQEITFPTPVKNYTGYFNPTYSDSWVVDHWKSTEGGGYGNNYVYQGGTSASKGCYFYGTGFAPLKGKTITKMMIFLYRLNTSHGVSGAANVYLATHNQQSLPGGDPGTMYTPTKVGTLSRGQSAWFNVPTSMWANIANQSIGTRGFGLYTTSTGITSSNYVTADAYNGGHSSGRVYVEYHS